MSSVASGAACLARRSVTPGVLFRRPRSRARSRSASSSSARSLELGDRALGHRPRRAAPARRERRARTSRVPGAARAARSPRSSRSSSRSRSAASSPGAGTRRWAIALHVGARRPSRSALALVVVAAALCAANRRRSRRARDYLTLTKPRIMTLLLLTGAAGMFVGAQGVPPLGLFAVTMLGLALACGGASALNHVLDRDIDALMGSRTKERPVASGRVHARAGARVRDPPLGDLVRAPRLRGERAHRGARARREPLLRPRLHALAQALDAAEHRHRRRRRGGPAARRLRGRDRDRSRCRRSGSSSSCSCGRRRTSGRSR